VAGWRFTGLAVQKRDHDSAVDRIYTVKEGKESSRRETLAENRYSHCRHRNVLMPNL